MPVVNTFIGNDKDRPLKENFAEFEKVWPDIVRHAADHGVKIAIENCPMIFSEDEWPGGNNLMYAPATWRDVFAAPRRRHARAQPRSVAPGVADDRLRAGRPRVRVADLPRPRQGHGDRPRRAVRARRDVRRDGLAGPPPARVSARSAGTASSAPCTAPGTTTPSSSSTRTVGSRAATRRSRPASTSPATPSPRTSPRHACNANVHCVPRPRRPRLTARSLALARSHRRRQCRPRQN